MRAALMYGAGDVRVEDVPDPRIVEPTDAIMRVVRACICGSDLWPYNDMPSNGEGQSMGHEAIGIVEAVGTDVRTVKDGQLVVMPVAISDGTCEFCREGLNTACIHVEFFGNNATKGGTGGSRTHSVCRRNAVSAWGRRRQRAHAVAAHPLRRDGYGSPRRGRRTGREGASGRGRRRRRCGALWGDCRK